MNKKLLKMLKMLKMFYIEIIAVVVIVAISGMLIYDAVTQPDVSSSESSSSTTSGGGSITGKPIGFPTSSFPPSFTIPSFNWSKIGAAAEATAAAAAEAAAEAAAACTALQKKGECNNNNDCKWNNGKCNSKAEYCRGLSQKQCRNDGACIMEGDVCISENMAKEHFNLPHGQGVYNKFEGTKAWVSGDDCFGKDKRRDASVAGAKAFREGLAKTHGDCINEFGTDNPDHRLNNNFYQEAVAA